MSGVRDSLLLVWCAVQGSSACVCCGLRGGYDEIKLEFKFKRRV